MSKSAKVIFEYSVRLCRSFDKGKPVFIGKGTSTLREPINRPVAEKWVKQGLGKIIGDAPVIEVKGGA
jgi:hypothetical protein